MKKKPEHRIFLTSAKSYSFIFYLSFISFLFLSFSLPFWHARARCEAPPKF